LSLKTKRHNFIFPVVSNTYGDAVVDTGISVEEAAVRVSVVLGAAVVV
jgi:hypothetical protein